jgi:crossover junction endodeoxyribonuclease RuvC
MLILGIDPGLNKTGYGIINLEGNRRNYITCGHIKTTALKLPLKLKKIAFELDEVIHNFKPNVVAIEEVFIHLNPNSALKLGQARGCAITITTQNDLPVFEYAATQIKKSLVGNGRASKEQIQFMVKKILNLSTELQEDAADALACAICHTFHLGTESIDNIRRRNISNRKKRYDWTS